MRPALVFRGDAAAVGTPAHPPYHYDAHDGSKQALTTTANRVIFDIDGPDHNPACPVPHVLAAGRARQAKMRHLVFCQSIATLVIVALVLWFFWYLAAVAVAVACWWAVRAQKRTVIACAAD
jgi:hypothetical protein